MNRRERETGEGNQWHLLSLLIASSFLLRTAGKVSARAEAEISLLFPLPSLSSLCLDFHFISHPSFVLIAGDDSK